MARDPETTLGDYLNAHRAPKEDPDWTFTGLAGHATHQAQTAVTQAAGHATQQAQTAVAKAVDHATHQAQTAVTKAVGHVAHQGQTGGERTQGLSAESKLLGAVTMALIIGGAVKVAVDSLVSE